MSTENYLADLLRELDRELLKSDEVLGPADS